MFVDGLVVFHNARFDWFHLSKIYNMFNQQDAAGRLFRPTDFNMDYWAEMEYTSRLGKCLKPRACVDTMILAQQGKYQSSLMDAKPIWIRRVPIGLAEPLRCMLEEKAQALPWILFAKRSKPNGPRWSISDCHTETGELDLGFQDLKLSFTPSNSLKHLAAFLCDHNVEHKFEDIAHATAPAELGYAPFVKLLTNAERDWLYEDKPTWPALLKSHIEHWARNTKAQEYAEDDIVMLSKLYTYFDAPVEDRDSLLACQVASVRLRGFAVDLAGTKKLSEESLKIVGGAKLNVNSPKQVLGFVSAALDPEEQLLLAGGCDQKVIDILKKEFVLDEREECFCRDEEEGRGETGDGGVQGENGGDCQRCNGLGYCGPGAMPVVGRLEHIEKIRRHTKRVELFNKLLLARRAYPDFNVIGAKSGRMSGAGGLNFHGIDHSPAVRSLFVLADPGLILSAGDYSSQEVAIAATVMNDKDLMDSLKSGRSFHAEFAAELYESTYEEIMETYHSEEGDERYGKGKSAVFLTLYGGTFGTLARNCNVDEEIARKAFNKILRKYPQMAATKKGITDRFSSIKQGADSSMTYHEVKDKYIESIYGFRRYFETEYKIQRMVWDTVKNLPPKWQKLTLKVQRDRKDRNRVQTIVGAISSALYGACFSIQNKIIRAANNHVIQSTGRELTIGTQAAIWETQPQGIHDYKLTLMSVHDEIAAVSAAEIVKEIEQRIEDKVAEQVKYVPLTSIEWFTGNKSWAEKGDGENGRIIGWSM